MMRFAKAFVAGLTLANAENVADAAQQPDVTGGALKLTYSDCGDGATHGQKTTTKAPDHHTTSITWPYSTATPTCIGEGEHAGFEREGKEYKGPDAQQCGYHEWETCQPCCVGLHYVTHGCGEGGCWVTCERTRYTIPNAPSHHHNKTEGHKTTTNAPHHHHTTRATTKAPAQHHTTTAAHKTTSKASTEGPALTYAANVGDTEQRPEVTGGALKLAYSDCGDGATHGKFISLSPTLVTLGSKTPLRGKGTIDESIQAATYEVDAKALFVTVFKHSGDACKAESINLPAGAGTINMHGFKCPLAKGDVELNLDLNLAGSIPAQLARLTIDLKAKTNTGDKALCAQIKTLPAAEVNEEVMV